MGELLRRPGHARAGLRRCERQVHMPGPPLREHGGCEARVQRCPLPSPPLPRGCGGGQRIEAGVRVCCENGASSRRRVVRSTSCDSVWRELHEEAWPKLVASLFPCDSWPSAPAPRSLFLFFCVVWILYSELPRTFCTATALPS